MLVHTLITKITPKYEHNVDLIINPSGRAHDRASWRKEFKREWKVCEQKDTSNPGEFPYERYGPDPHQWICACPAYQDSRFLICKHLVQLCHPVSPWFFLEAERQHNAPFWVHPSLVPLADQGGEFVAPPVLSVTDADPGLLDSLTDDDLPTELNASFANNMENLAFKLEDLASYARHQIQFGQYKSFAQFQTQCSRSLKFYDEIKDRERTDNTPQAQRHRTWQHPNLMFIYTKSAHG